MDFTGNIFWFDIVGLIGVFIILFYYLLLQTSKIGAKSLTFSLANTIGSVFILVSLWFDWNLASVTIEISWLLISVFGVYRALPRKVID